MISEVQMKNRVFTLWEDTSSPLIPITSAPAFLNFSYESLKAQACRENTNGYIMKTKRNKDVLEKQANDM